jgi:tetratricopeptide (TPR) repeat protein
VHVAEKDDLAVSFAPVDRAWAEWVLWQLDQAWLRASLAPLDGAPGGSAARVHLGELKRADRILLLLTPASLALVERDPAWVDAFAPQLRSGEGRVIALLIRTCAPRGRGLALPAEPIDLRGLDEESAVQALVRGVRRGLASPRQEPGPGAEGLRKSTRQPTYPAGRAPVWRVPRERNPAFAGRDAELGRLAESLSADGRRPGRGRIAHLVARGSRPTSPVGLTELATEHAYARAGAYGVVWWVRASERSIMAADLCSLAHTLGLPERRELDETRVVGAVRRWLAANDDWLLIVDGLARAEWLSECLPEDPPGHAIVAWGADAGDGAPSRRLEVDRLDPEATRAVVRSAAQRADLAVPRSLAERLDGCVCAAALAGAYLRATGSTPEELARDIGGGGGPDDAWRISFARLRSESPAAAELVEVSSFLDPEEIPVRILSGYFHYLPPALAAAATDHETFDAAVAAAARLGFVRPIGESAITVPGAIQRLVRRAASPADRAQAARSASAIVCYSVSSFFDDARSWVPYARWLGHASAVLRGASDGGHGTRQTVELAKSIAASRAARGRIDEGLAALNLAMRMTHRLEGPHSREAAQVLREMAWLEGQRGDARTKRALLEQALAVAERASGPASPDVAERCVDLAAHLEPAGDAAAAERLLERALAIHQRDVEAAAVAARLARLREARGDLAGAVAAIRLALSVEAAQPDPDSASLARLEAELARLGGGPRAGPA